MLASLYIILNETNKTGKMFKWIQNYMYLPAYSTLIAVKRVFVYSCKMFAFKTEVLGQSGTTAATGLTSFIYLKHQNKKNIHKMKDPSTNMYIEAKNCQQVTLQ